MSSLGAGAPIVAGTTFIFVREPYCGSAWSLQVSGPDSSSRYNR